jgi:hypothetical protein
LRLLKIDGSQVAERIKRLGTTSVPIFPSEKIVYCSLCIVFSPLKPVFAFAISIFLQNEWLVAVVGKAAYLHVVPDHFLELIGCIFPPRFYHEQETSGNTLFDNIFGESLGCVCSLGRYTLLMGKWRCQTV